ncbi:DUF2807 domain-containing protein [Altererythrobacter sp. KTW20L]|uniref:head GIN domain-containing protein n=1 Tax=Altererythrobacter sp. KTW20L TaxID=2942210 RepID=UPI0020BD561A|nr:head GIN domain-containing protein [Altererythrobacter sp. KTW20L]MCL6249939.1 DUF2807 domain-containing protein [Altererythrobacter sp. KTW20L]
MNGKINGRGFEKMFRAVGPFVAMAAMSGVMAAQRKNGKFQFDWDGPDCGAGKGFGAKGSVPLDDLDMGGETPTGLVLAGADRVTITEGEDFAIAIQGDDEAKEDLRFCLKDGALHVASNNSSHGGEGVATITVTMPAPHKVTLAGSGEITVECLPDDAEVVIAGSGRVVARDIAVDRLDVSIAGSGRFKASGKVARLDLNVAGSGSAKMGAVMVDKARVTIAGSGNAVFASDGEVKARLMGSGTVTVRGGARCKVQGMGTGSLVCERRDSGIDDTGGDSGD